MLGSIIRRISSENSDNPLALMSDHLLGRPAVPG